MHLIDRNTDLSDKLKDFDYNYLGHSFILAENQDWSGLSVNCAKCEIKVFYYSSPISGKSMYIDRRQPFYSRQKSEIIFSCNEYIIKNIIE